MSAGNGNAPHVDVAIVGSGFAGLGAAHRLEQAGIEDFAILERAADVGGTWWANTYPGCQCDVASHLYSFSFAPNPDWTRTYSMQPEIQAYLRRTAERFGLVPYVRFGHEVRHASWDEEAQLWRLDTAAGPVTARVVVGGQGGLSEPRVPDIPGRDSFEGPSFHSASWDHTVDLAGKRVAVLGTGASAIQIVPSIQPQVGTAEGLPAHTAVGDPPHRPADHAVRARALPPFPGAPADGPPQHLPHARVAHLADGEEAGAAQAARAARDRAHEESRRRTPSCGRS